MTDRELMQQALDALEMLAWYENPATKVQVRKPRNGGPIVTMYPHKVATEAAAPLRSRLAQPEQEPVAYDKTEINCFAQDLYDQKMREGKHGHYESMFHVIHRCIEKVSPPAHRKPLTEKRIEELYSFWVVDCQDIVGFARAVERTVKGEA